MSDTIKYQIRGLTEFRTALHAAPVIFNAASIEALDKSVAMLESELSQVMPIGPGHFGAHLADSFQTHIAGGRRRIYGDVFTSLPQGKWLETGTRPHDIAPHGRDLVIGQQPVGTVVHHPGERGRHLARIILRGSRTQILSFFREAYQRAMSEFATHA